MRKQPKLLLLLGGFGLVLIIGVLWMGSHSSSSSNKPSDHKTTPIFDVAAGDTNNEVLRSIVAKQKTLQTENAKLLAVNQQLQASNAKKTTQAVSRTKAELLATMEKTRKALQAQIQQAVATVKQSSKGLEASDGRYALPSDKSMTSQGNTMITTVADLSTSLVGTGEDGGPDMPTTGAGHPSVWAKTNRPLVLPSDSDDRQSPFSSKRSVVSNQTDKTSIPHYTIPDGATAANAVLLSPLIGEVPVNGQLVSPAFPFKAVLSHKNTQSMFAANGVPLPVGIAGTVLQGYAVGNMSLGCTRAYVLKILFVFQDGHFVVFPKKDSGSSATKIYPTDAIGYLSDPYNNACLTGKYITDAPKVIASLASMGAVAGVGSAIAQAQTQTLSSITQGTTGTVINGNLGKYAGGVAIGQGATAALDWYKARVNDIFDAVFLPSTVNGKPRRLVFNVTKTIAIDWQKNTRTLRYENQKNLSATDTSLQ